jgi:hypothetical protein
MKIMFMSSYHSRLFIQANLNTFDGQEKRRDSILVKLYGYKKTSRLISNVLTGYLIPISIR